MHSTGLHEAFRALAEELCNDAHITTQELLRCDRTSVDTLVQAANALLSALPSQDREDIRASLSELTKYAHHKMASSRNGDTRGWRRIYTDASVLLAYTDVLAFLCSGNRTFALAAVSHLDHAIVIAGAPGEGRLDSILDMIDSVQSECLDAPKRSLMDASFTAAMHPSSKSDNLVPAPLLSAANPVPRFDGPPSLGSFVSRLSMRPFVLPGFLLDWPALNEHPWSSLDYLRTVAGPGRVVPVEVGSDYRSDDWTQEMMPWDTFLGHLEALPTGTTTQPVLYLAQHSLFNQFPALKNDMLVPDYVHSDLDPPADYPQYAPPANEERLVLNAWLGPAGAISPAHTDPFFDCFAQAAGRKTVWLAPPEASPYMYAYTSDTASEPETAENSAQPRNPAANNESPSLSNTSRVDVFVSAPEQLAASKSDYAEFWGKVVPSAMSVTLEPGDLLFFPPGWWHAMRSEETSFSVSMWF